jgi:hypothetical protein
MARKASRLAGEIEEVGTAQAFYQEFLVALGYKNNRQPFRRLAGLVPLAVLADISCGDPHTAYAALVGASGLIPAQLDTRWDVGTRRFVRGLWDTWWKVRDRIDTPFIDAAGWRMDGLRPTNHPLRRMAAAAALFASGSTLSDAILELDDSTPHTWLGRVRELIDDTGAIPYWKRRTSLVGAERSRDVRVIGDQRRAAIIANVILPLLAAAGRDVTPLVCALPAEHDNALIRRTAYTLLGPDHNPDICRDGRRQQGLLQIMQDFCLVCRPSCAGCALAAQLAGAAAAPTGQA